MSSSRTPLTENNVDSIVLNAIKNNKFSSVAVIAHFTRLHENIVNESFNRLIENRRIYLSVGGLPKRYSHTDDRYSRADLEEYPIEKPIVFQYVPEGTVIH